MRRRMLAAGIALAILIPTIGYVAFAILEYPAGEVGYNFEREVTATTPDRIFFQIRSDDAAISIDFIDDPSLLYSIDVTPYSDSTEAGITFDVHEKSWGISLGTGRQKAVDITLGTGCFYFINMVDISNLNTTITYSNNAWLNGSALAYSDENSNLTIEIDDEIRMTDTIGFSGRITCHTANIAIEVPQEWNAFIDFHESNLTISEMTGWRALYGEYGYRTDSVYEGMPKIEFDFFAEYAFATLSA